MKTQLIRRIVILAAVLIVVLGFSSLLNRASFDPDFTLIDAVTYATKHSKKNSSDNVVTWEYSIEELVLPDASAYTEETIESADCRYVLLHKSTLPQGTLVLLSDKDNTGYANAVHAVAEYYEQKGYTVEIREHTQTMMISLAHAEHFDLFLLRQEES